MLRFLILLLLLANVLYFSWSQGLLASLGFAPLTQGEPARIQNQIKPEAVRVLPLREASAPAPAPAPQPPASTVSGTAPAPVPALALTGGGAGACLQAGLFSTEQAGRLRSALQTLPSGSWRLEGAQEPGRWLVYMGKYPDSTSVQRKVAELRVLSISPEPLNDPKLQPGISLGEFDDPGKAQARLAELARRGVRTARVLQERAAQNGLRLSLPQVDDSLRARLEGLKPVLDGKPLENCKT